MVRSDLAVYPIRPIRRYNVTMAIRPLSALLVNQIAAGEVIERPASVVRELIDNALDAGARRIDLRLDDGGRKLIRVADDGCGIEADDLPLALAPHATSKIACPDDLHRITTLGFRGEALASVASVAQVRLTSRPADQTAGHVIEAAGDHLGRPRPVGCAPGTVVEVRNLFFNTPARCKFLRGAPTEFGHINETVSRIAMAQPAIAFTVEHNGRRTLDLPATDDRARRCFDLLGADLSDALLEFESDEQAVTLWGLAGLPAVARATARYQYFFVNGRPIRDRRIAHAVKEAYRGLIEPARQPIVVLFITIDPRLVDVNVHPAKAEVRFADANRIHGQVLAALRARLLQSDLTPAIALSSSGQSSLSLKSLAGQPPPRGADTERSADPATDQQALQGFVDYFKRIDPGRKNAVYQQVRQALADEADLPADADSPASVEPLAGPIQPRARQILQVHDSYIVTQDDTGIVIIDQHALHERVMFATLIERIGSHGRLESQRLLSPAVVDVSPQQLDAVEPLRPLLERLGIEVEPMGPKTLGVHAFATLLFDRHVDPGAFVVELIDRAIEDGIDPTDESALHRVLDMMSCKAAVKAGEPMSEEELADLLAKLKTVDRSSNCPHGRPTTIRLTLGDLEKHFKRT